MKKRLIPSSDLIRSCQTSKQGWEDPGDSTKKEEEGNQLKKSTTTGEVSSLSVVKGTLSSALSGTSLSGQSGRCVPKFPEAKPVAVVMGEKSMSLIFISQLA